MPFIYIVIENGDPYLTAYDTYAAAVAIVKQKHHEQIEAQIHEVIDLHSIECILSDINVPENKETGHTTLYVEKGIHIHIYKIPITNI